MTPEAKMAVMPSLSPAHDHALREWVKNIDPEVITTILRKDGLNADWPVARLKRMQALPSDVPLHVQLHRLWLGLDGGWTL